MKHDTVTLYGERERKQNRMDIVRAAVRAAEHTDTQARQAARQAAKKKPDPENAQPLPPGITGAMILDDNRAFAATVIYMSDPMLDALVLFCAVTHVIDSFTTVPRGLATAPQKQSGKSTLLKTIAMLSNNPWKSKPTSFALRAKFNDREKPTVIVDEISGIYGRNGMGRGNQDLDAILREGYECDAILSLANDRVSDDVSCYCVAAMAGMRNAVPDDIWSRCIEWKVRPVPPGIRVRDALDPDTQALGRQAGKRLHQWARAHQDEIKAAFRTMRRPHRAFRSRLRQIWGPLYAVALVAGGDWPERCIAAFREMALDASQEPELSPAQMVLRDAAALFRKTGAPRLFGITIREHLERLPDVEMYQAMTPAGLTRLITEALGPSQSMDIGTGRARGYHARPVLAAWAQLEAQLELPLDDDDDGDEYADLFEITEITASAA